MMRPKALGATTAILIAGAAAFPSLAHHSFAMFDRTRTTIVQGTVSRFDWTNPHVFIGVDALGKSGKATRYVIECGSISILSRNGWKMGSIKVGDTIRVAFFPLKSGEPGGLIDKVTLRNNTTLTQ